MSRTYDQDVLIGDTVCQLIWNEFCIHSQSHPTLDSEHRERLFQRQVKKQQHRLWWHLLVDEVTQVDLAAVERVLTQNSKLKEASFTIIQLALFDDVTPYPFVYLEWATARSVAALPLKLGFDVGESRKRKTFASLSEMTDYQKKQKQVSYERTLKRHGVLHLPQNEAQQLSTLGLTAEEERRLAHLLIRVSVLSGDETPLGMKIDIEHSVRQGLVTMQVRNFETLRHQPWTDLVEWIQQQKYFEHFSLSYFPASRALCLTLHLPVVVVAKKKEEKE